MTRIELNKFNIQRLPNGTSRSFEVRNHKTHFGEWHYFHRTEDGALFHTVTHQVREAQAMLKEWLAAPDREAYMLAHMPKNFEPVKACPCRLCKPVDMIHE